MYATKRRRRTVKTQKTPVKDPPKSNPSKRHRERLNSELDHLASLLPFEQSVISKLDKLSILRLAVSYLRTKSYFAAVLPDRYNLDSHHIIGRSHLFHEPGFSEGDSILQALYGFMVVITCDGEVFYASRTVEQYLGFHQSDIIHQSVMELIHSEDREEFKRQLSWNSTLPQDKSSMSLHELMMPENARYLHRSFTVRFRCLLDNTSGFITLEISGWIRVLHGQNVRTEEPQLALFATCCPFGPLSLMDIPSRELTFKSKHKMDFSPMSMDNRGKAMFGFADRELATKSGYDLIHPDDLNYFSSAHQELIKTGSSGLIAYRWCTKDFRWLWLQSSCKVIYKNSKPDFVICTHRQLTDDEGADLFHKRGNEFKLPYPLLDLDICSGFDFPNDEIVSKMKNVKNKKQKTCVRENYVQSPGRKRKCSREPVLNGYAGYPQYNGYDVADFKPDLLYPYPSAIEPDIYRGYASFHGSVYPGTESYRLADSEKHAYTNGYYLDPHRQYQHTLAYPGNGYSDLMAQPAKFGYDVTKYGFNSYDLDIAKKAHYGEDVGRYDNDYRKYAYEYGNDRLPTRLNGSIEPVDLRSSAMYNGVDGIVGHNPCLPPTSSLFKETKVICSPSDIGVNQGMSSTMPLHHSSVIKNAASPRSMQSSRNSDHMGGGSPVNIYNNNNNNNNNSARVNVINNTASWQCTKPSQNIHPSPISTPRSDPGESPKLNCVNKNESSLLSTSSPVTGATPASVIHSAISNRTPSRIYDKQPMTGGIPVPVVKTSPWYQYPSSHAAYGDPKDWSIQDDMYSCHQKRGLISDNLSHLSKVTIT